MDPRVRKYLEKNVLEELGLTDLPPKRMEELLLAVGEVIQGRINLRVLDELSDTDKDKLDEMLGKKAKPEEVDKFLREKIKDLDEIVARVIADSKQEMVEKVKMLQA